MNEIQIFKHPEFGEIRTVEVNGEPWLVGKDVTAALGYLNSSKALTDHVDNEDKLNNESLSSLGQRGGWLINESGLYSLALSSRLPGAKKFRRWVTSEVLPSIRKHGGYIAGQETMSDEELMAKALLLADSKIKARDKVIAAQAEEIKAMRPAQVFSSAVTASSDVCLVGELAKLLRQNGVAMGQNRFFEWLRLNGYLIRRDGADRNLPTQKSMELGLFEIEEVVVNTSCGAFVKRTPKVTGKGQQYFINKFLEMPQGKRSN